MKTARVVAPVTHRFGGGMTDLAALEQKIEAAHRRYADLRSVLDAAVAPHRPSPDTTDQIITYAEEFGAAQAVKKLGLDSSFFQVTLPPETTTRLAPTLDDLVDAGYALDRLVGEREDVLCADDPLRDRRLVLQGEEVSYREAGGSTLRLADGRDVPAEVEMREGNRMGASGKSKRKTPRQSM